MSEWYFGKYADGRVVGVVGNESFWELGMEGFLFLDE